jgi:hypothetical protein
MKNQPMGDDERQLRPAKHFDDKYWIDLVRGLNQGDHATEMEHHLNAGCEVFRRDRDLWLSLVDMGRNDSLYEPSKEIIQPGASFVHKRESLSMFWSKEVKSFGMLRASSGNAVTH